MSLTLKPILLSAGLLAPAHALILGPYVADSNTVHLFHLDEVAGSSLAANSGSDNRPLIAFNGLNAPAANTSVQPTITSLAGAAGAPGFGGAAGIGNINHGFGLDANNSGGFQPGTTSDAAGNSNGPDAITHGGISGADGSFTLEALVKFSSIEGFQREIIATDSSGNHRGFQFRINTSGSLEFNFIKSAAPAVTVPIPRAGPHAFVADEWFHVAISFTGTTGSCNFFWTRLAESSEAANSIGIRTETTDATVTGPLVIGNEGRGPSGEGLLGQIDEVRISNVARNATQFLFSFTDTDEDDLSDAWEILHFREDAGESDAEILAKYDGVDDPDRDGVDNAAEFAAGTEPNNPFSSPIDSDSDGLPDPWELANFSSVTAQSGSGDADCDFATNRLEYIENTNPNNSLAWPNKDEDQLNDGWEIQYFGSITAKDGTLDSDLDGASDKAEHDANTHPLNALWSPTRAQLAHRWSFNNSLEDTAGGSHAVMVDPDSNPATGGDAVLSSSRVLLEGGPRASSSYISLGSGLLAGRRTPVTIELWATRIGMPQNWSRIFDFGSGPEENLFMSWTRGTDANSDRIEWVDAGTVSGVSDSVRPYTAGTQFHILMTLEPRAGAVGSTRVTWYAAPADAGSLGAARGGFDTDNTLNHLNDVNNWLGRSQYASDATASASYDEVRIWNGAFTPGERETYHALGAGAASLEDSEPDGLPDAWELRFVTSLDLLSGLGGADHDRDGFSDLAEYQAGSNPDDLLSTPLDTDADGMADAKEMRYFGTLLQTPNGDPDGDGENNATELTNGSAPNNRASGSTDIDGDGLPDAWETSYYGTLELNGGSDPDGDGFGNLQEFLASTLPGDAASRPSGIAAKLVPVDDGDHGTSEFGFAGASAINTVSFVRSSLKTVGNQQFITWYGRHQFDASAAFNNTLWIGRRTLGTSEWEVFRHPSFTANDINDGHDVISYGIDGDGYMHLSWGMHGDEFHYSRSTTSVLGDGPIVLGPDTTMTGQESIVTYPQFIMLPDGDLLFLFRRFYSGNGAVFVNRYGITSKTWSPVHTGDGGVAVPFMSGMWAPSHDYNPYVNMPQLGGDDGQTLTLTYNWRYLPVNGPGAPGSPGGFSGYQTNNRLNFARSPDAGLTWQRFDGTPYQLPITRNGEAGPASTAEVIEDIPEGSSLINQASMCLDGAGNPVTAAWWAPMTSSGNFRRQYMVNFRHQNGTWQTRPVSSRNVDPPGTRFAENAVRNLGRPIVVNDDADRVIVIYRDNDDIDDDDLSSDSNGVANADNGITVVHSLPLSEDPDRLVWMQFDLTRENLGNFEPIIDNELWDRDRQLHLLHQASAGEGYTPASNNSARMSVLEWDTAAYFSHLPQPGVSFSPDGGTIRITCPSQPSWSYRLWTGTTLGDWSVVETRVGTGDLLVFTHPAVAGETKRFWRIEYKEGGF